MEEIMYEQFGIKKEIENLSIKVENEMYTGGEIIGKKYRLKNLKKNSINM